MNRKIKFLTISLISLFLIGCSQEHEVKEAVLRQKYYINIEGTINYDSENCNYYFSSSDGKYSNYILDNKTKYVLDDETIIEYINPDFFAIIDNKLGNVVYCDLCDTMEIINDEIYSSMRRIYSSSKEESYYTQEILKDIGRW